jgi:signal-transduction protein with cAMP-binding, CBS, and nucleotidyltransferase domain
LAREYGVGVATINRLSDQAERVRNVAEQVAAAQTALAALPVAQQHMVLSLADKLRSISDNLAAAAMHGAATAHRLNALANAEAAKVDDLNPLQSMDALKGVGVLSKLANESASVALNLLAANKPTVEKLNAPTPPTTSIDVKKLSPQALQELLAARDAAVRR